MRFSVNNDTFIRVAAFVALTLLDFVHIVSCQCSGTPLVLTANETFQTFTSTNYPSNYPNNEDCEWLIEAENITHMLRLEVTDSAIEYHADCVYDAAEVFDGFNTSSDSLGVFCGTATPTFVSTGYRMTVTFSSDYSLAAKGFEARFKSGATETLPEEEEEENNSSSSVDIVTVIAGSVGGVALLVVFLTVIFIYIQSRKAKRHRERLARRGLVRSTNSSSRVHPFDYDYRRDALGPPPPPAYGDIFRQDVMSPPPAYSEVDPNPQPPALPGTPDTTRPGYSISITGISNTSDFNSNTRFTPRTLAQHSNRGVTRPSESTSNNNPQRNIRNVNERRSVTNAGALAAMQILNPSAYATNNSRNTAEAVRETGDDSLERQCSSSLPTETVISPRERNSNISGHGDAEREITSDGHLPNVVEVEVHRNRSDLSEVSDLSEMSLPGEQREPSSLSQSALAHGDR